MTFRVNSSCSLTLSFTSQCYCILLVDSVVNPLFTNVEHTLSTYVTLLNIFRVLVSSLREAFVSLPVLWSRVAFPEPHVLCVGLCLCVQLGARCNRLKLVHQARQPGPTLCVGFIQGGRLSLIHI